MKSTVSICMCLFSLTVFTGIAHPADTGDSDVHAFPVVAYPEGNADALKPFADEVSKLIGTRVIVSTVRNPVCCVWLELTGTPNPGEDGYIILHQSGGTVIQASTAEQMQLALKRWKKAAKRREDRVVFPIGLMTNYKVVD